MSATLPPDLHCSSLIPTAGHAGGGRRPLTPEDLVGLRDIGPANNDLPGRALFSISPDGKLLALQLRKALPSSNDYCLGMFVVPTKADARPRAVDIGGELIRAALDGFGKGGMASGIPLPITPQWSDDGKILYFLKRMEGSTQIWLAQADGKGSRPLIRSDIDIEDFRLIPGAGRIVYSTRPALAQAQAAIAAEGLQGFHYDERYSPVASNRPLPSDSLPFAYWVFDLDTGLTRSARDAERTALDPTPPEQIPQGSDSSIAIPHAPWISTAGSTSIPPVTRPAVASADGRIRYCAAPSCSNASGPAWWDASGKAVRFLRREGWANSLTSIYEWRPETDHVRRLYQTQDYLVDCHPIEDDLLCAREQSLRPRHIIRIGLSQGHASKIFDPNPELRDLSLGKVERINNINSLGIQSFADLVYPVGYRPGQAYPTIVVQYVSRGFLRGGTGDEFPIQAYANAGYAVLSVHRPLAIGLNGTAVSVDDANAKNLVEFSDRRSTLSSIEVALNGLIQRGIVDRQHIGITGLSDGSSTVQFAALHSSLFAAGAVSSCCWEPMQGALFGPATDSMLHRIGWPRLTDDASDFWSQISLSRNAHQVRFPILFSMADDEYLPALESFTALRQRGVPADMFVFPDEHHVKWQPAHRLATYQRSIAWFDFWLKNALPPAGRRLAEAEFWQELRDERMKAGGPGSSAPARLTPNSKGG